MHGDGIHMTPDWLAIDSGIPFVTVRLFHFVVPLLDDEDTFKANQLYGMKEKKRRACNKRVTMKNMWVWK